MTKKELELAIKEVAARRGFSPEQYVRRIVAISQGKRVCAHSKRGNR